MSPRSRLALARVPFLLLAFTCLFAGLWAGLHRLGWGFAASATTLGPIHGPLMVSGFFGALISVERAVAHGARWAYLPALSCAGSGVLAILGVEHMPALLATAGALGFSLLSALLARRQVSDFSLVLVAGGLAWLGGNALWLSGAPIDRVLPFWIAFLVSTIFAERRELGRVLAPGPAAGVGFIVLSSALFLGAGASLLSAALWRPVFAASLGGVALWLGRFDVARFTVRRPGLTRFIALGLLGGYVWIAVAAVLLVTTPALGVGPSYDALVHSLFLGFVFSMVFAHAPVIFPAILGVPLRFTRGFYSHLGLLHASLIARVTGDLVGLPALRAWGGLVNALSIVLFLMLTARAVVRSR